MSSAIPKHCHERNAFPPAPSKSPAFSIGALSIENRSAGSAKRRSGTVLVLSVFLLVTLFAIVAFAVDLGYLAMVRTELQRTADSAAIACASAMYKPGLTFEETQYYLPPDTDAARDTARQFAQANMNAGRLIDIDLNLPNSADGYIVVGRLPSILDWTSQLEPTSDMPNTVQVLVPMTAAHKNGPVSLFFANVLGINQGDVSARASATVFFPSLLPFATSQTHWDTLAQGGDGDQFNYDRGSGDYGITQGSDGISEITMYPGSWNGKTPLPPGNFGIIQVGAGGSTLSNLRRQIDMGPSMDDMAVHGNVLAQGDTVPGRTGLKSSTKLAFLGGSADGRSYDGILGRVRQLPLYTQAVGNGANCVFTLSGFRTVRVVGIQLDGVWRTAHGDTAGNTITGIAVQPVNELEDLIQVQLTR